MSRKLWFRKKLLALVFWALLVISFLFFASLIILKAQGWQLNWHYWRIQKTGMIILDGEPKDVQIKVNQKYLVGFPEKLANQSPGTYEVTVTRDGYHPWQKALNVESGKAISSINILLFYDRPTDIDSPEGLTSQKILSEYQSSSRGLEIRDKELYWQKGLLTRFNDKILAASLYPDEEHFVCQIGNEIRILDLDGSNNILLFSLSSYEPSAFTFRDNGQTIIYLDEGAILAKTIR